MKKGNRLLLQLAEEKRRNFEDNLKFVILRAEWLKRISNKEWSTRHKSIADSIYKANRKLRLSSAKG